MTHKLIKEEGKDRDMLRTEDMVRLSESNTLVSIEKQIGIRNSMNEN